MHFYAEKIHKLNIGWNERPLTESDLYCICNKFKIKVVELPLRVNGFYYRAMEKDFIAIDSRLDGIKKRAVLFHELAHFLFHTPKSGATASFHGVGQRTKSEREADMFALCAIIPKIWLIERSHQEIVDEEFIPNSMLVDRLDIFARYGL